jgi:ABC-type Na+ efflux pump permease subunit
MLAGPIIARDLLVASRQPRTYRRRTSLAILILVILAVVQAPSYFRDRTVLSVQELATLVGVASFVLVFCYYNLAFGVVPIYVAEGIAAERERRVLGDLLRTRLSSADIVLGKLAAGLAQFATNLAIGLPIVALLPFLSGLDAGIIMLACAGIASTAYFVGGLSILIDGEGRDAARPGAPHHWHLIRRPACGESAMRWKEMHTAKSTGST